MEQAPPTRLLAFVFAVLGGLLFATGHAIAGAALTIAALACAWAWVSYDGNQNGLF